MNEMTCREFVELATAFLDGALDSAAEARYLDHAARCAGCDRYAEQIQRTIGLLGAGTPGTGGSPWPCSPPRS